MVNDLVACLFSIRSSMAEPNIRLSGVKQEQSVFKSEFGLSFENLRDNVEFSNIKTPLNEIENNFEKSLAGEVNESMMNIKNSIIDALRKKI